MKRKAITFLVSMILVLVVGCMPDKPPTEPPVPDENIIEQPTSTAPPAPTLTPTRPPLPTEAPPTVAPLLEPTTAPPTEEQQPAFWKPQSPDEPCQPSEKRRCAILYILADKYDDEHVLRTKPAFERSGYTTFVASNTLDEIRGFHECYDFTPAQPDLLLEDVDVANYDAIVFAGSDHTNTSLHNDPAAHRIAQDAMAANRVVVAAISDGPVILAKAGLLEGRTVAVIVNVYMHGVAEQWLHAIERRGAIYSDRPLVRDGLLITADIATVNIVWGILEVIDELP